MTTSKYSYGLGRRKAATARARLFKGKGEIHHLLATKEKE